jgi:hypothetical protein
MWKVLLTIEILMSFSASTNDLSIKDYISIRQNFYLNKYHFECFTDYKLQIYTTPSPPPKAILFETLP